MFYFLFCKFLSFFFAWLPYGTGLSFSSVESFEFVVMVVVCFLLTLAADLERDLDFDFSLGAAITLTFGRRCCGCCAG